MMMWLERGKNLRHSKSFVRLKCKLLSGVDTIIWSACCSCNPWQLSSHGCLPGKPWLVFKSQAITSDPVSGLPPLPLSVVVNVVFRAPEQKVSLGSVERKFIIKFLARKVLKLTLKLSLNVNWLNDFCLNLQQALNNALRRCERGCRSPCGWLAEWRPVPEIMLTLYSSLKHMTGKLIKTLRRAPGVNVQRGPNNTHTPFFGYVPHQLSSSTASLLLFC